MRPSLARDFSDALLKGFLTVFVLGWLDLCLLCFYAKFREDGYTILIIH